MCVSKREGGTLKTSEQKKKGKEKKRGTNNEGEGRGGGDDDVNDKRRRRRRDGIWKHLHSSTARLPVTHHLHTEEESKNVRKQ